MFLVDVHRPLTSCPQPGTLSFTDSAHLSMEQAHAIRVGGHGIYLEHEFRKICGMH